MPHSKIQNIPQELNFKISVLVFVRDEQGRLLLIERLKEPNKNCWSPIGGKLEMRLGESPFECAIRETREEIGLEISEIDLHMFSMISEKAYEGNCHWLMFLFDCKKRIKALPKNISEGSFAFFEYGEIMSGKIKIPETDRTLLWNIWEKHRDGMVVLRAECGSILTSKIEQVI